MCARPVRPPHPQSRPPAYWLMSCRAPSRSGRASTTSRNDLRRHGSMGASPHPAASAGLANHPARALHKGCDSRFQRPTLRQHPQGLEPSFRRHRIDPRTGFSSTPRARINNGIAAHLRSEICATRGPAPPQQHVRPGSRHEASAGRVRSRLPRARPATPAPPPGRAVPVGSSRLCVQH